MRSSQPIPSATPDLPTSRVPGALSVDEALRRAGRGAALSHQSAARAHGLELTDRGPEVLSVPRDRSRLELPGWRVVRADIKSVDLDVIDDVPVTAAERTIVDLARVLPVGPAVATADSALRANVAALHPLQIRLLAARGRSSGAVRQVAPLLDPASESVLESLTRVVLVLAGLTPTTQHEVWQAGRFVARLDFAWPAVRLAVEADGFAFHADRAAYRRDRERLNELERLGWRVLRFTWEDVVGRPDHVVALVRECLRSAAA